MLVYEYQVTDTFNIYLVNRNQDKAIPAIFRAVTRHGAVNRFETGAYQYD